MKENNKLILVYGTREMEETSLQEFDASSLDLFRVSRPQFEEQESLELRLETKFSWGQTTVGAYFWDSEYDAWQSTYFFVVLMIHLELYIQQKIQPSLVKLIMT